MIDSFHFMTLCTDITFNRYSNNRCEQNFKTNIIQLIQYYVSLFLEIQLKSLLNNGDRYEIIWLHKFHTLEINFAIDFTLKKCLECIGIAVMMLYLG